MIVIPNSILFTNSVQVMTHNPTRRTDLAIGLDYNTPLEPARTGAPESRLKPLTECWQRPLPEKSISSALAIVAIGLRGALLDPFAKLPSCAVPAPRSWWRSKPPVTRPEFNIPYPIRTTYFFDQTQFDDHYPITNGSEAKPPEGVG